MDDPPGAEVDSRARAGVAARIGVEAKLEAIVKAGAGAGTAMARVEP